MQTKETKYLRDIICHDIENLNLGQLSELIEEAKLKYGESEYFNVDQYGGLDDYSEESPRTELSINIEREETDEEFEDRMYQLRQEYDNDIRTYLKISKLLEEGKVSLEPLNYWKEFTRGLGKEDGFKYDVTQL